MAIEKRPPGVDARGKGAVERSKIEVPANTESEQETKLAESSVEATQRAVRERYDPK